jgi:hypothetical protein
MNIEFAITYCCENLQLAMIKREWWFQLDINTGKCILVDENDMTRLTCPYCYRSMEDVVDVIIEGVQDKNE